MKWQSKDEKNPRVRCQSGWKDKDSYSLFDNGSGIYILANDALQVKYVGKAGPGRIPDEIGNAIRIRNKGKGATKVQVLYTTDGAPVRLARLERQLICKYQPPNNETWENCPRRDRFAGGNDCGGKRCERERGIHR